MTVNHDEAVATMLRQKPEFRRAMLREIVGLMLNGDMPTGKSMLRKYVVATAGFSQLEARLNRPANLLAQMLEPNGQPLAIDLFNVITYLEEIEGGVLEVIERAA